MTDFEPPAPPPPEEVPVWVPFATLVAVLVVVSLFGAAVYGVIAATDPSIKDTDDLPESSTIALTLVQDVVFVFGAWIAVKLSLGYASRERFGLRRVRGLLPVLKWAAAVYGGFWLVTAVLSGIFGTPDDQSLVIDIKGEDALAVLIAWGVLICVVAPFVEELFFRGFMFTVFARRLGVAWAAVLDGAVFGLGHAPAAPIQLIALGAFGLGLCLLYWRTKSIIPCMALHALNNSITFGVVKDLDQGLFVAVVVVSVGAVVAAASAVSARSAVAV